MGHAGYICLFCFLFIFNFSFCLHLQVDCTQNSKPAETDNCSDFCTPTFGSSAEFEVDKSSSSDLRVSCNLNEISEDLSYCKSQIEHLKNKFDTLDQILINTKKPQMFNKSVNEQQPLTSVNTVELEDAKTSGTHLYGKKHF